MTNYFRITAYHAEDNISIIVDSNGLFDKLWQFSSYLVKNGFSIFEVSSDEKIIDVNITKAEPNMEYIMLRANADGQPEYIEQDCNGVLYKAVQVGDKIYIPNKDDFREYPKY